MTKKQAKHEHYLKGRLTQYLPVYIYVDVIDDTTDIPRAVFKWQADDSYVMDTEWLYLCSMAEHKLFRNKLKKQQYLLNLDIYAAEAKQEAACATWEVRTQALINTVDYLNEDAEWLKKNRKVK